MSGPSANGLAKTALAPLRYGAPISLSGELDKEGKKFRQRKTRYFRLRDGALYNHRKRGAAPTWGLSVIDSNCVILPDKKSISISTYDGTEVVLLANNEEEAKKWVKKLELASSRKIGTYYGVTGIIGMGSFAEVRLGYDKASGDQVAIKIMKKNPKDKELMKSVDCEMNFIEKMIIHDNVVKTWDVFNTKDNLFIVMEYCPGGMLYDILAEVGQFSEMHAAMVMRDLLNGIKCLHDHDIVHRDIKPENVLCENKDWPLNLKVADFGLADFVLENNFGDKCTRGMYGTPFFVAPEVIRGEFYGPPVDIWSCGVLLYNMLSGQLPFDGNSIKEVLRRVKLGEFDFPDEEWSEISNDAKDLIRGLLCLDSKKRLTAQQALQHKWLVDENLSRKAINNDRTQLASEMRKSKMSSMAMDNITDAMDQDAIPEGDFRGVKNLKPPKFLVKTKKNEPHSTHDSDED